MIRIGYQGIEGSNSRASAENMAVKLGFPQVEYVPLVTSQGVVDALVAGQVEYGVMATHNFIAGPVGETERALSGLDYRKIADDTIPIHHCLFVKDASVITIDTVASHIQALNQCKGNLDAEFPGIARQELIDTAIGARYLSEGKLPETTGVLCRKNAGEDFGLYLLRENMEDDKRNRTDFIMITLADQ